ELLLLFALLTIFRTHLLWSLLSTRLGIIMAIFLAWQFVCTVPHVGEYGLDTLRDSVIWGYALFAFVAGALVLRLRGFLRVVLQRFNRFAILYLFIGPAAWLATLYLRDWLPTWPGTTVSVPLIKGDEYGVHLAGIFAFSLQRLGGNAWWALLIVT